MKISIFLSYILLSTAYATSWNINDVSILLKLPSSQNTLLTPRSIGVGGELFQESIFNSKIGLLSLPSNASSKTYSYLRASLFALILALVLKS